MPAAPTSPGLPDPPVVGAASSDWSTSLTNPPAPSAACQPKPVDGFEQRRTTIAWPVVARTSCATADRASNAAQPTSMTGALAGDAVAASAGPPAAALH